MAPQSKNDDTAVSAMETRYFTGTIPDEILLSIIERCDVHTLVICQTLSRSINQLISLFSHQIVKAVASQQGYYNHPIFTRERPDRLTVAYLLRTHTASLFCRDLCVKRFGKDVVNRILRDRKLPEKEKEEIRTFMNNVLFGCSLALRLVRARYAGEKVFADEERGHRKTLNRQLTAHWRLEKYIEQAQAEVLRNTRPLEVWGFKLFWFWRGVTITPPERFRAVQEDNLVLGRRGNRSVQRKEVQDLREKSWTTWTRQWAAGYLLDYGTPKICGFRLEGGLRESNVEAFDNIVDPMSERHSKMSYEARIAHLERAQRVLDSMDSTVARTIYTMRAQHNGQSLQQQQQGHNRRVMRELKQYLGHLRLPGRPTIPFMSSQPFAELLAPGAAR
jgi:hypothetical protein